MHMLLRGKSEKYLSSYVVMPGTVQTWLIHCRSRLFFEFRFQKQVRNCVHVAAKQNEISSFFLVSQDIYWNRKEITFEIMERVLKKYFVVNWQKKMPEKPPAYKMQFLNGLALLCRAQNLRIELMNLSIGLYILALGQRFSNSWHSWMTKGYNLKIRHPRNYPYFHKNGLIAFYLSATDM